MVAARKRNESFSTRRRCGSCQQRHIKCEYDGREGKCKACRSAGRKCVVKHRFQVVDPSAPKKRDGKSTRTVDIENQERVFRRVRSGTAGDSNGEAGEDEGTTAFVVANDDQGDEGELNLTVATSATGKDRGVDVNEDVSGEPVQATSYKSQLPPPPSIIPFSRSNVALQHHDDVSDTGFSPISSRYSDPSSYVIPGNFPPIFPTPAVNVQSPTLIATPEVGRLNDKEKAILLRHFTDVLSRWFDVCDPDLHFRRVVPVRALTCPTLMKAISASAAWHLCRQGKFDRERSTALYENCLEHLIRAMDSSAVSSDDSVLVAAVIMHHVEELRDLEHTPNLESRGHIIGMQVFLNAHDPEMEYSSLRTAAFRTAVREELHVCFVDQQPLTLPPEVCCIDRDFSPADDDTWAWRAILLFRDALSYSLSPSTTVMWDTIWSETQSWRNLRPSSFNPTYCQEARPDEGLLLPEMWFLHDCHIIGMIHYHLCRLLLAISNPRTPKLGFNRAAAVKRVEEEVRDSVVEICGIATSNHLFPSAMTAASMVTTMCAEHIREPPLQAALLDILVQTRQVHAWPTEAAQKYVKSVWRGCGERWPGSTGPPSPP